MNPESFDINLVRGILLILLIIAFAWLWIWAWGRGRKEVFDEMASLPLEEDDGRVPQQDSKIESTKE